MSHSSLVICVNCGWPTIGELCQRCGSPSQVEVGPPTSVTDEGPADLVDSSAVRDNRAAPFEWTDPFGADGILLSAVDAEELAVAAPTADFDPFAAFERFAQGDSFDDLDDSAYLSESYESVHGDDTWSTDEFGVSSDEFDVVTDEAAAIEWDFGDVWDTEPVAESDLTTEPEAEAEPVELTEEELQRRIALGQMPGFSTFTDARRQIAAENEAELAWQEAQARLEQRRGAPKRSKRSLVVVAVGVVALAVGALLYLRSGTTAPPVTIATPAAQMPWRQVSSSAGLFHVDLPAAPTKRAVQSPEGIDGEEITAKIPGITISVSVFGYPVGANPRTVIANAFDAHAAAANAGLGDSTTGDERWGKVTDVTLLTDREAGVLRAGFVGTTLYVIEVIGPLSQTRTQDVIERVFVSFTATSTH